MKPNGPIIAASTLLGIGQGGFADGIVLHPILQWHNMISHKLPPGTWLHRKAYMFWDGRFHACTWIQSCAASVILKFLSSSSTS